MTGTQLASQPAWLSVVVLDRHPGPVLKRVCEREVVPAPLVLLHALGCVHYLSQARGRAAGQQGSGVRGGPSLLSVIGRVHGHLSQARSRGCHGHLSHQQSPLLTYKLCAQAGWLSVTAGLSFTCQLLRGCQLRVSYSGLSVTCQLRF